MLKGTSSLKKTLLFGTLAAGGLAVTGFVYWKYLQKCEKQKKSKRDAEETRVKSTEQHSPSADVSGQTAAEVSPDLIPFAKKVVDEAVEKGVEQYHNEHCATSEKDTIEVMEKERKDSGEAASSSGSSGQSDMSFEKIGDFDQLQESCVGETGLSSAGIQDVVIGGQPESLQSDFSIISESKAPDSSLQTSGGFSLIQDESSSLPVRNESPDVIVVGSDSSEEHNRATEVGTSSAGEPDVIPSPPILPYSLKEDTMEEPIQQQDQDVATSQYDVIEKPEETTSKDRVTSDEATTKIVLVDEGKVEVKTKDIPVSSENSPEGQKVKGLVESQSPAAEVQSGSVTAAGDSAPDKTDVAPKGQGHSDVIADKKGAGDPSSTSDKDGVSVPLPVAAENLSSESLASMISAEQGDERVSQSEDLDTSRNTSTDDSFLSAS